MKFLVDIQPNPSNPFPADRGPVLIEQLLAQGKAALNSGAWEACYITAPGYSTLIAEADSAEDVWVHLQSFSFYPYWLVKVVPAMDAVSFVERSVKAVASRPQ